MQLLQQFEQESFIPGILLRKYLYQGMVISFVVTYYRIILCEVCLGVSHIFFKMQILGIFLSIGTWAT